MRYIVCCATDSHSLWSTWQHVLAKNQYLIDSCVKVAGDKESPLHSKCLEILRNLTLFPGNNGLLTRYHGVVGIFIAAANSPRPENRISALRALQNLASDASSKGLLAVRPVLDLLTSSAMRRDPGEKAAAVAALYNITTEPSAVVAVTNTENVIATLVHLAHSPDSSSEIRLLACEALATTSLWLQTLAGTGKVPEGVQNIPLPSHKTYGWERWE